MLSDTVVGCAFSVLAERDRWWTGMPTPAQFRQACTLLNWGSSKIVQVAGVSYETARRVREDDGIATVSSPNRLAVRTAMEEAGVRFHLDVKGRPRAMLGGDNRAPSPDLIILRFLAGSEIHVGVSEIATALKMALTKARTYLVVLESMRLISGCQDPASRTLRRVFIITDEGRRTARISDAQSA